MNQINDDQLKLLRQYATAPTPLGEAIAAMFGALELVRKSLSAIDRLDSRIYDAKQREIAELNAKIDQLKTQLIQRSVIPVAASVKYFLQQKLRDDYNGDGRLLSWIVERYTNWYTKSHGYETFEEVSTLIAKFSNPLGPFQYRVLKVECREIVVDYNTSKPAAKNYHWDGSNLIEL